MPALPPMPDLAPFLERDQFHAIIEKGHQFWISDVRERTGQDPKGNPKQELVYTIFCPELIDGPGAFSLDATGPRRMQADLIRPILPEGTVGPCILRKKDPENPNTFYVIEPAV